MKQCTRCKQQKSTDEFYHNRTMKDGLDPWYKTCAFFEDWISRGGNPKKPLVVDPYNTKLFTEIVYIGNEKLSSFVLDAVTKELRS